MHPTITTPQRKLLNTLSKRFLACYNGLRHKNSLKKDIFKKLLIINGTFSQAI